MTTLTTTTTLDPTVPTAEHPTWCSPARCTVLPDLPAADGLHLSTAVTLSAPLTVAGALAVQAWLQQVPGGDTYLVINAPDIRCGQLLYPVVEAATGVTDLQQLLAAAGEQPTTTDHTDED